ncbi:MAG: VWA domain-containing protein [Ruminococcus sp.]|nr:VWA domain-containing protein [Ruminococcus sp.]
MKTNNISKAKKILSLAAALMMTAAVTAGCGQTDDSKSGGITKNAVAADTERKSDGGETADEEAATNGEAEIAEEATTGDAAEERYEIMDDMALDGAFLTEKSAVDGVIGDEAFDIAFGGESGEMPEAGETEVLPEEAEPETDPGEAFVLTAGEWNDLNNWGFFANLVNNGTISFPSYGLDPRNRVEVTLTQGGEPCKNQTVTLYDKDGSPVWTAVSDREGKAYLFYTAGQEIAEVRAGSASAEVSSKAEGDGQGNTVSSSTVSVELETEGGQTYGKTEVMFILDTTGSMSDEIAYLQKDFSSIAKEVSESDQNISFSVNFYRDEGDDYVTKTNPFTTDVKELQALINAEYADGGGDWPEAVAEILDETMDREGVWSTDANKVAFLIFDAPPHDEKAETVTNAVKAAAEKGIHIIPVVSSNSERETELFGRALAISTNSNYVFLTDDSGVGGSHLEPIIGDYEVELLHDVIVRNIRLIAETE